MITLKIIYRHREYDLCVADQSKSQIEEEIEQIMLQKYPYYSGMTNTGNSIYFPIEILQNCVIEIIESEEDNEKS